MEIIKKELLAKKSAIYTFRNEPWTLSSIWAERGDGHNPDLNNFLKIAQMRQLAKKSAIFILK